MERATPLKGQNTLDYGLSTGNKTVEKSIQPYDQAGMTSENGEKLARPTDEISKDWVEKQMVNFSQYVTPDKPPEPPPLKGFTLSCPRQAMDIPVCFKSTTGYIDASIRAEHIHPSDVGASA
ncbi:unnamed protein product [Adineta ricciae]|uniref:Uncharacterized protein n=1 Tax=Adineta ricciae TaxID=249248 RepID=A0A814A0H8_ADIRI|nr:unnamed protein product [Adineta ricciae]CAF1408655.1 unnamed protein product [Adineta ricciae]